jgi:ABC-type multidrug transport system fused ATPase/permease subunit
MFDVIYVFDNGKAAESGSFDALRSQGGMFARMWEEYSVDMDIDTEEEMTKI